VTFPLGTGHGIEGVNAAEKVTNWFTKAGLKLEVRLIPTELLLTAWTTVADVLLAKLLLEETY